MEISSFDDERCVICGEPGSGKEKLLIVQSGIDRLKTYAALFELASLSKHLNKREQSIVIHCQKKIANKFRNGPSKSEDVAKLPRLSIMSRSVVSNFDLKGNCLFCSKSCVDDPRHQNRSVSSYSKCETLDYHQKQLKLCEGRMDDLALTMKRRIMGCSDVVAAEARYHRQWRDIFTKYFVPW